MKFLKAILINVVVLLILIIIIEIFWGSWFFKKNSLKNLNVPFDTEKSFELNGLYKSEKTSVKYSRDNYGLRGNSIYNTPEKIDILTIGGSTTDQGFIDDSETWQMVIERELKKDGYPLNIANAGIDGQSTFGHIKNFELWFPNIPDLHPKYVLFYIGINDLYYDSHNQFDVLEKENSIITYIKNNSALINLIRKIKGVINSKKQGLGHVKIDLEKYSYVTNPVLGKENTPQDFTDKLPLYEKRIIRLIEECKKINATPVFVSQPSILYKFDSNGSILGLNAEEPFHGIYINGVDFYYFIEDMNECLKKICAENNLLYIDLTNKNIFTFDDYYDFYHTTPSGCDKIGTEVAKELIKLLIK